MLEKLKKEVYDANMALPKLGLVLFTWGNVSGVDRERGLFVIKPSGVAYDELSPEMMVVVGLDGKVIKGELNPSSDTPSHIALYNGFPEISGVAHTHSTYATSCAQAGVPVLPMGTTHADYFYGEIPVTRDLTADEINTEYELNTGLCIIETINNSGLTAKEMPSVFVKNHGPFTWGKNASEAVHNAAVLEETAKMFIMTKLINPGASNMPMELLNRHFFRKHGANATYGQK